MTCHMSSFLHSLLEHTKGTEVEKMSAVVAECLRICALLSFLYVLAYAEGSDTDVNEKCQHNLTKFDPYLSHYIGKR